MSINNIGGNIPIPQNEPAKKEDRSPDNYPGYGSKSAIDPNIPNDSVVIYKADKKSGQEAVNGAQDSKDNKDESPDNYPSYGDKALKEEPALPRNEKRKSADASVIIYEPITSQDQFYIANSPDNYPSYGEK